LLPGRKSLLYSRNGFIFGSLAMPLLVLANGKGRSCVRSEHPDREGNRPASYRVAGLAGAAGWANFAASMGALGCTSVSSVVDRPSSQLTVHLNGILTP